MKTRLIFMLIFLVQISIFSQTKNYYENCSCSEKSFIIINYNEEIMTYHSTNDTGFWYYGSKIENGISSYDSAVKVFNKITEEHLIQIDSIIYKKNRQYITNRGGEAFFCKLNVKDILISKNVKLTKGIYISYEYTFENSNANYSFTLNYDINGNLLNGAKFPNVKLNSKINDVINFCTALKYAYKNKRFRKRYINSIVNPFPKDIKSEIATAGNGYLRNYTLIYDEKKNIWKWIFITYDYDHKQFRNTHAIYKYWYLAVEINAHNCELIDLRKLNGRLAVSF